MVKLYFQDGSVWEYELLSSTNKYIYMSDLQCGASIRYDKGENKLYSYDCYNNFWKYMKNTTEMLDRVEIIE